MLVGNAVQPRVTADQSAAYECVDDSCGGISCECLYIVAATVVTSVTDIVDVI